MKGKKPFRLIIIGSIGIAALALVAFSQMIREASLARLQQEPSHLEVEPILQSKSTSCGEAAIVMAFNYAYPETKIREPEVIDYASAQGYFTAGIPPFTSPVNMVKIARHYSDKVSSGTVFNSNQGLLLLSRRLRTGEPVIIDVLSDFTNPESEAHFILVTGVSADPNWGNAILIHYDDPLTGPKETADWSGNEGVWHAWQNNGDPGGAGWWMVISA